MDVLPAICDGLLTHLWSMTSAQAVRDDWGRTLREGGGGSGMPRFGTQVLSNLQEFSWHQVPRSWGS